MRSYSLAIALTLLLSAFYVYQNPGDVTVVFFAFEKVFPQGIWEALLFAAGVFLMWIFSILASLETWSKHRAQIKERDKKIADLESERTSLLNAISRVSPSEPHATPEAPLPQSAYSDTVEPAAETTSEERENETV